jgi:predicted enzyme involved in methoxymalonyl-ACP biosynthesis
MHIAGQYNYVLLARYSVQEKDARRATVRQYNNNIFIKLTGTTPQSKATDGIQYESQPRLLKLSGRRNNPGRRFSLNNTTLAMRNTLKEEHDEQTLATHRSKSDEKILPYVTVFFTDLITNYENVRQKLVVLDLEKYFEVYFKKVLRGPFTSQFYTKVDHYIHIIE